MEITKGRESGQVLKGRGLIPVRGAGQGRYGPSQMYAQPDLFRLAEAMAPEIDARLPAGPGLLPDMVGRRQVLDRDPEGLEESDLAGRPSAGQCPRQDLPQLPEEVVVTAGALAPGDQEVSRLIEGRLTPVDEEPGADDGPRIQLARSRETRTDGVDVRAR